MDSASRRAVWLFYAAAFLESLCFYAPVASLYRLAYGVTLFQITLAESAFFVVSLLLEVPWGLLTARIGYKNTLLAAGALNLLAEVLFWRAAGFPMFLLQRCVLAAALSGFSGCDVAYLARLSPPGAQHRVLGRYQAVSFAALVAVGACFPLVEPLGLRALALATVLCTGAGFVLRLWLPQVGAEPQELLPLPQQLRALGRMLRDNRPFLLLVLCGAVLCEVEHTLTVFFAAPAWQAAGLAPGLYGLLHLSLNLTGALGSLGSARLAAGGGGRAVAGCWLLALTCSGALCLTQAAPALLLLLPLLRFAAQGYLPCEQVLKNQHTGGAGRAVALSAYNMAASAAGALLGPLLGAGTGTALRRGFFAGFGLLALAAVCALGVWPKIQAGMQERHQV